MAARTRQGPGWLFVRAPAFVRRSELAQRPVVEPEIREAGGSRQKTSQLNLIFPLAELSSKDGMQLVCFVQLLRPLPRCLKQ